MSSGRGVCDVDDVWLGVCVEEDVCVWLSERVSDAEGDVDGDAPTESDDVALEVAVLDWDELYDVLTVPVLVLVCVAPAERDGARVGDVDAVIDAATNR